MLYFVKNEDNIEKNQVFIDWDELSSVESEINKNCTKVKHHVEEYNEEYFDKIFNKTMKNVHQEFISEMTFFEKTVNIYRYTYDEVIPSPLIETIHKLYKEDSSALDEIFGYYDEIKLLSKEIKNIEAEAMEECDYKKFDELMKYMNSLNNNRQKLVENIPYVEKIKSTISFQLIDSISIDKVDEINKFYEKEQSYNYSKVKIKGR